MKSVEKKAKGGPHPPALRTIFRFRYTRSKPFLSDS